MLRWPDLGLADRTDQLEVWALRGAPLGWADRWNLRAFWRLDTALITPHHWAYNGWQAGAQLLGPTHTTLPTICDPDRSFTFSHEGWEVQLKTRPLIEEEIRADFETALAAYLRRIERSAEAKGLERAPHLRSRVKEEPMEHDLWLVRWQVSGCTRRRIAEEFEIGLTLRIGPRGRQRDVRTGLSTVRDGLVAAADLLDLDLGRGRQGRTRSVALTS